MDKFTISAIITALFIICKMVEMKFLKKEEVPIKKIGKDGIMVYACALAGLYLGEQFANESVKVDSPDAYTGTPEF